MKIVLQPYWTRFREWSWRWVVYQVFLSLVCLLIRFLFGIHSPWKYLVVVQWAFLYLQFRSYRWRGIELVLWEDAFKKWELITSGHSFQTAIIYKKRTLPTGYTTYSVFPFRNSRWGIINKIRILGLRILLAIKLYN